MSALARLLVFLLSLLPLAAWAGPRDELRDAENWFTFGDFENVVRKLTPVVEPTPLLADRKDLARAYELLGLSSFYLRREAEARKHFERLVRLEPEKQLDPFLVPPPAINFFEDIRRTLAAEIAKEKEALQKQRAEEEERRRQANLVVEKTELRRNSRFVAAMPLGAGQFQSGDVTLGSILLGSQVLLAGLSIGFYGAVENLRQPSGRFAHTDFSRAEAYQAAQLACGYAALLVGAGGILHAQLAFQDDTQVEHQRIDPGARPPGAPGPTISPTGFRLDF